MGLQTDAEGNFYYAKGARHALPALVPHHGTLLRVSRTACAPTWPAASAPNGARLNPDGTFMLTDQEGHWTPENRVNWVHPGRYYGNFWAYHYVTDPSDEAMEQPVCWITNAVDRSPSELVWVEPGTWGPLAGKLLNLSYGYGKVYVIPFEESGRADAGRHLRVAHRSAADGNHAGPLSPAGPPVLHQRHVRLGWRARRSPAASIEYRYTGRPMHLPIALHAVQGGLEITFTDPLDRRTAGDVRNYTVETWALKRVRRVWFG